ncbi:MAG: bifunctional diaminohydroxyphosphoribosylaminopyrimidine deaminase/5-amino-6-(5-phosphoribosylamino)uracil reductase RibD [Hyphomicrobium sp.]
MSEDRAKFDAQMMRIALMMAGRGLGLTAPNPSVGAVIADEATGEVIARAVTAPGGRPHAEPSAIALAGERAAGKTIYVTLEPCSHYGKTPPCADAIITAGLKRAVVAIEDPDPRVAGRGLDRLRAAGLEVRRGVGAEEARWITRGHIVRVTERRPFVTLKMALDSYGSVPQGTGAMPVFVTSPQARAHGHLLRAQADAILVGAGTIKADNPQLTCRLPGLEGQSPLRVVLSKSLDILPSARLFDDSHAVGVLCVAGFGADPVRKAMLERQGAEVALVPVVAGQLWLPAVMEALVARGITRLLVEGGPGMWAAFGAQSLVDEIALYVAGIAKSGRPAGEAGLSPFALATSYSGNLPLAIADTATFGPDRLWRLRTTHKQEGN